MCVCVCKHILVSKLLYRPGTFSSIVAVAFFTLQSFLSRSKNAGRCATLYDK